MRRAMTSRHERKTEQNFEAQPSPGPGDITIAGSLEELAARIAKPEPPPERIGGYRIIDTLGQGGMGTVYRATQLSLDRMVALKVVRSDLARHPSFLGRFLREARIAPKNDHPNVVTIYDTGEADGHLYMALQFVPGGDLASRVKNGRLGEDEALRIITECAKGLRAIHLAGLVHRDIKPANIFLSADGTAKVGDLGLARQILDDDKITFTGDLVGTPAYMAPEQALGEQDIDGRADLYALGTALYHLLTGNAPFMGSSPFVVGHRVISEPAPDPRDLNRTLSPGVAAVIHHAMRKDRNLRYQTADQFIADLEQVRAGNLPRFARITEMEVERKGTFNFARTAVRPVERSHTPALVAIGVIVGMAGALIVALSLGRGGRDGVLPPPPPAFPAYGPAPAPAPIEAELPVALITADPEERQSLEPLVLAPGVAEQSRTRPPLPAEREAPPTVSDPVVVQPVASVPAVRVPTPPSPAPAPASPAPAPPAAKPGEPPTTTPVAVVVKPEEPVVTAKPPSSVPAPAVVLVLVPLPDKPKPAAIAEAAPSVPSPARPMAKPVVKSPAKPPAEPQVKPSTVPAVVDHPIDQALVDAGRTRPADLARNVRIQPTWASEVGADKYGYWAELVVGTVPQRFRLCADGTFVMGSPADEPGRQPGEGQHRAIVAKPYWLAETEVTQPLWRTVMTDNPSSLRGADLPVDNVSWQRAQDFLAALNAKLPGLRARLPSEAEWEAACRAGTRGPYSGGMDLKTQAWFDETSENRLRAVAAKHPNALGLFDLHGNVWEWCRDSMRDHPPEADGTWHAPRAYIFRGGSYAEDAANCRAAMRGGNDTGEGFAGVGLRLAITADER